jgi:hypothetical protein
MWYLNRGGRLDMNVQEAWQVVRNIIKAGPGYQSVQKLQYIPSPFESDPFFRLRQTKIFIPCALFYPLSLIWS